MLYFGLRLREMEKINAEKKENSCLLGLPDDLIEKGKDIKSVSEIDQNGDSFKVTITTGSKVMVHSFTIGQECEVETMTGEKVKARPLYFYACIQCFVL